MKDESLQSEPFSDGIVWYPIMQVGKRDPIGYASNLGDTVYEPKENDRFLVIDDEGMMMFYEY